MTKRRSYDQYCALARALDAIGDRWSMLIVRNLILGPLTWSELLGALPGMAKNLLSSRLTQLQSDGIIMHSEDEYALTQRGMELEGALFALADWGERHFLDAPRSSDALRLRYLMTALRRKLQPVTEDARLQLIIAGQPFFVRLGPQPILVTGEEAHDATVHGSPSDVARLLREPVEQLVREGALTVQGEARVLSLLQDSLSVP